MLNLNALFVGLLFGLGLIISGMTNPAKVAKGEGQRAKGKGQKKACI